MTLIVCLFIYFYCFEDNKTSYNCYQLEVSFKADVAETTQWV